MDDQPTGIVVQESRQMREGQVIMVNLANGQQVLILGVTPPTDIQRQVRDGIMEAHPWIKDPLLETTRMFQRLKQVSRPPRPSEVGLVWPPPIA